MLPSRSRSFWTSTLLLPAVTLIAGCDGSQDQDPLSVRTPTSYEQCNHGPQISGDGAAFPVQSHWLNGEFSYEQAADFFVCVDDPQYGGEVKIYPLDGVHVSPTQATIIPGGNGIVRFKVLAEPGTSGRLRASFRFDGGGASVSGPDVGSDKEAWSFSEPD